MPSKNTTSALRRQTDGKFLRAQDPYVFGIGYQADAAVNVLAQTFGLSLIHRHRLALPALIPKSGLLVSWGPELAVVQGLRWARTGPGVGLSLGKIWQHRKFAMFLDASYAVYIGGWGSPPPSQPLAAFGIALRLGFASVQRTR